jgi:hypothetical protein
MLMNEQIKASIARGQEIERIDSQIASTKIKLETTIAAPRELGISIKNPFGDRNATA